MLTVAPDKLTLNLCTTKRGQYYPHGTAMRNKVESIHMDQLADGRPFLPSQVLTCLSGQRVSLTFSDAASVGLPLITVPEGSVFSAYQYLLPFGQKHESQ